MAEYSPEDLARWCRGRWLDAPPHRVSGVSHDTRSLRPGNLYVAIRGATRDGHAFLAEAAAAGASAVLVDRETVPSLAPRLLVGDTRSGLRDLALGYRARLDARFLAVTGSSGKTTVKEMIADALGTLGPSFRTQGNWNNDLGVPLSLLAMPRDAAFGVFEVGMNHPGELDPLCALVRPEASVVTCVGPVHIEFFESEEGIAHEKASVVRAVPPSGFTVLPRDDRWFHVLSSHARCEVVTASMRQDADYRAESAGGLRFRVTERATGETASFVAPLPGDFILHDALLAIAMARRHGAAWAEIARALAAYRPLSMRWQRETSGGVRFVNDAYNANPMSMRAALQGFAAEPVEGRRWLVLGPMYELGRHAQPEHEALGREVAGGRWGGLLAVGPEGAWIASAAAEAGLRDVVACPDAKAAAAALAERARAGDGVLLKASRGARLEQVLQIWKERIGAAGT